MNNYIKLCENVMDELGRGFTENIYHECLCALLRKEKIEYSKEVVLPIKKFEITVGYVKADIVVKDMVIECKAINELQEYYLPQIIIYMELLDLKYGIFVNFVQNPSKECLQLYCVEKNEKEYIFKNHYNGEILRFDKKGNKIMNDDRINEWIKNRIIDEENGMLSKDDCKKNCDFKKTELLKLYKLIEEYTGKEFKDKQIENKKYKQVIMDYSVKL